MSCNCFGSCSCGCVDEQPINIIEQAVNDALAGRIDELDGYTTDAKDSADAAKVSELSADQSADEAKGYRDETLLIYQDAQGLVPEILEASQNVEDAANAVNQAIDTASSITVKKYFYEIVGGESTITVPAEFAPRSVQYISIEGFQQWPGHGFEYDASTRVVTLDDPFDSEQAGRVAVLMLGTINADSPETFPSTLASSQGATMVGVVGGGTVQDKLDSLALTDTQLAGRITTTETSIDNLEVKLSGYIRVFSSVLEIQAATNILVGARVRAVFYYPGIANSGAEWIKTAEITTANQHPVNLQRLAFSDSMGNVYTLVQDPTAGINLEQLGGLPYNSADLPGCDTAPLWLALLNYKRTIASNRLTINLPAREYYSSKGIPVYQWTTVRSTGKLGTQYRIGKGLWTDAQIPYVAVAGVNTFWSIKSFHFSIVHPAGVHASNVELSGIDFVTNAGDSTDYGLYLPYFNDLIINGVRNTGIDIALYYVNGYSSLITRHLATARVNSATTAGSWGVRCVERSAGTGCGTSVKFVNCGYTDFILGWSLTGMTYTHIDTCYTEGTLSEVVGAFTDCPNLVFTSYGIERLTSKRNAALIQISGGSVVINGLNAAFAVSANSNIFLQVSGNCKITVNGLNMKYLTNGSTTGLITTGSTVEALIAPVVYPDTGTYANNLGANTYMLGTGGNVTPQTINAAAVNFNSLTDPINTTGKFLGKSIYDRTLGCVVYASGATAASVWRNGIGTAVYTPV